MQKVVGSNPIIRSLLPRDAVAMNQGERFSDELEQWLRTDEAKTLGQMNDVFGEKAFAVTILLLMFLPALPLPTGGVSHVFELITILLAGQMVLGRRTIWLPGRWQRRELGAAITEKGIPFIVRRIRQVERVSRPRATWLFEHRWLNPVLGLTLIAFAAGAAIAPPFSGLDTLPALGAVLVALSVVLEDVVVLAVGVLIGAAGLVVIFTIGTALARLLRGLF
jgi:hypothetical protein